MLRYLVMGLAAGILVLSASCASTTNVSGVSLPTRAVSDDPAAGTSGNDVLKTRTVSNDPAAGTSGNDVLKAGTP